MDLQVSPIVMAHAGTGSNAQGSQLAVNILKGLSLRCILLVVDRGIDKDENFCIIGPNFKDQNEDAGTDIIMS